MKLQFAFLFAVVIFALVSVVFNNPWFYFINGQAIRKNLMVADAIESLGEPNSVGKIYSDAESGAVDIYSKENVTSELENAESVYDFDRLQRSSRVQVGIVLKYENSRLGFRGMFGSGSVMLLFYDDKLIGAQWE